MEIYTKIQRRKIYQKLLKHYRGLLEKQKDPSYNNNKWAGLCVEAGKVEHGRVGRSIDLKTLHELYSQKPKRFYLLTHDGDILHRLFWWNPYNIKRRIKAIEEAIKLTY